MKKNTVLKTKRLRLTPMTVEELDKKVLFQENEALRAAYSEMLEGCRSHPESMLWYAPWTIMLKNGTPIGDIGFKGPQEKGAVEIGYGLESQYEGNGYMTEAAGAMLNWAFSQTDVYAVYAETEPDNQKSQRVLEKLKFERKGEGKEGPRFVKMRDATAWTSVYMMLGMSIGMSIGSASGNMSVGLSLGIAIGLAVGAGLDANEKKHRKEVLGE